MTAWTAPQELHDLAFRYALAVDTRDAAKLASVFTVDGAVLGFGSNPIVFRGGEGLSRMIVQVDAAFGHTMHNVYNQTFERAADGAITGITYSVASHVLPGESWNLLDMAMRYHNCYAQEGGVWKYQERRLEVMWVETRPVQKFNPAMMDADLKEFK